jgi:hypothetical protein
MSVTSTSNGLRQPRTSLQRRQRVCPRLETLEDRTAPSAARLGVEFQVNTFTDDNQWYPDVAVDANGNFVVV